MMSQQPVVVTKMLPCEAASSIVVTSKPSIAACRALIGSISVTITRAPSACIAVGAALADVAIAGDDDDLAGDHHVGGPLDAVGQRFAAAVEVVELALGDRVVDVDRRAPSARRLRASGTGGGRRWSSLRDRPRMPPSSSGYLSMDHGGQVAAVVEDHVQRLAVGEEQRLLDAPVELFVGLPFQA